MLKAAVVAAALLVSCRDKTAAPIRIVVGPTANDETTLTPRAALAELIEISPTESALLLTLTSAERTCESVPTLEPEEAAVAIRLVLPAGAKLEPATYPMLQAAATPDKPLDKPSVLATVKLHGKRQELRAGGDLQLTQIDPNPQGVLEGLLKLEFTGDAEHPATRVSGRFVAHFCRINRLR